MVPLGLLILVILIAVVLAAPRRLALLALLAGILYLTKGISLELFGVKLYAVRLLGLAAITRVVARQEWRQIQLNGLDRAVVVAYALVTAAFLIRTWIGYGASATVQQSSAMDKVGTLLDVTFGFFAFRSLIRTFEDLKWLLQSFVVLLIPFVTLLWVERFTGQNPFAAIGGAPSLWVEAGRSRCRGSFVHPSLLGTFGAALLPLYIALAAVPRTRFAGLGGALMCLAIVAFASSGGPLTVVAVGVIGWALWPLRARMYLVRWAMAGAFVAVLIVMKAPIWYLPDRLSSLFGGDGWHRSYLMDQAFAHLGEWWLAGIPLDKTVHWFPYLIMGAADITNSYLMFGLDGGLPAMIAFVLILVRAFRYVGRGLRLTNRPPTQSIPARLLVWGLGVAVAGHAANFLAITYFDQTYVLWLMQLAAVSSLAEAARARVSGEQGATKSGRARPAQGVAVGCSTRVQPKGGRETMEAAGRRKLIGRRNSSASLTEGRQRELGW